MARKAASNSSSFSVFILLDRSGSMVPRWAETLDAINAYVREIAATQPKARVSVVAFDDPGPVSGPTPSPGGMSYTALRVGSRAAAFKPIHQREVSRRGSTPLLDAVGRITATMHSESPDRAMLVIVTDGRENASREWTKPRTRSRLDEMKAKDWQILFVGADFDAFSEAGGLRISQSSTLTMASGHYGAAMASMASRSADYAATGQAIAFSSADRAAASGGDAPSGTSLCVDHDGFVEIETYPDLTDDGRPPRSARVVAICSWSWSPANSRTDIYRLHRDRSGRNWTLWLSSPDSEFGPEHSIYAQGRSATALKPVDAARALLRAAWEREWSAYDSPGPRPSVGAGLLDEAEVLSTAAHVFNGRGGGCRIRVAAVAREPGPAGPATTLKV